MDIDSSPIDEAIVGETYFVRNYNSEAVVKYVGPTEFSNGVWVGLELPTPTGKNDGSVQGKLYFSCKPRHGIFVRTSACFRIQNDNAIEKNNNCMISADIATYNANNEQKLLVENLPQPPPGFQSPGTSKSFVKVFVVVTIMHMIFVNIAIY